MGLAANRRNREQLAQRRDAVLKLRLGGATYRDIATRVGISRSQAVRDCDMALTEIRAENDVEREKLRDLQCARYEMMLNTYWNNAINGDGEAVERVFKALARIDRIMGLDNPSTLTQLFMQQIQTQPSWQFGSDAQEALLAKLQRMADNMTESDLEERIAELQEQLRLKRARDSGPEVEGQRVPPMLEKDGHNGNGRLETRL